MTLLSKPYAVDLHWRFWPEVTVVPFIAPWTRFKHKYRLFAWHWRQMFPLRNDLAAQRFDFGLSARWDPRDHLLLLLARTKTRLGFPPPGERDYSGEAAGPPRAAGTPLRALARHGTVPWL